jgi:hypothetical protein
MPGGGIRVSGIELPLLHEVEERVGVRRCF